MGSPIDGFYCAFCDAPLPLSDVLDDGHDNGACEACRKRLGLKARNGFRPGVAKRLAESLIEQGVTLD